jgi:MFS family permease
MTRESLLEVRGRVEVERFDHHDRHCGRHVAAVLVGFDQQGGRLLAMSARHVPRVVKSLGWVSFFTDAASEMIYPLLPALLSSFGAAAVWLGAMEGIAEAIGALAKWRIGSVVDRGQRRKPLILVGYGVATLVRPLIALASAGGHVVVFRSIDRVGKGIRGVPRDTLVAESTAYDALTTAYSFHRMMDNAGSVLGPILAFALMQGFGLPLRTVIALAIVPGLVAMAALVFGVHEKPREPEHPRAAKPTPPSVGAVSTSVRRYLVVLALFTLGSSADSFLLLRVIDLGLDAAYAPLVWVALSGVKSLSNIPGGWIGDRLGARRTLTLAWCVYAAVYAVAPHITGALTFAAVVVIYGIYYGLAEGSERAILAQLAPPEAIGRAFGALHAVTGLAVLPANLLFGALYIREVTLAFTFSAACAIAAAGLLLAFVPAPERPTAS